jgi:hypothetical protein
MSTMVTVTIGGELEPRRLPLPQAIVLAWQTLRHLPLGKDQLETLRPRFGVGAEQRIRDEIAATGRFEVCFLPVGTLDGDMRSVVIAPADVLTGSR